MKNHKKIHRVDVQVAIMTSCLVILSSTLIFLITYALSYQDMIRSLQDRVFAIYCSLEERLEGDNFSVINNKEDMLSEEYQDIQVLLQEAKEIAGVMYLYTAKKDENGSFIYVVDGLDPTSEDFRYPGDLIELEIQAEMDKALTAEIVMPEKIKNTSWGSIFIAYLPIMDGDDTIGVLGIEFDAGHQYKTYQQLLLGMIGLIILFCIIGFFVAFKLFRRISNPSFRDLSNTDILTGLKNRNAFDIDIHNWNQKLEQKSMKSITLLSVDLDDLKIVNDTKGHLEGDNYINSCVEILKESISTNNIIYRTGGDEFTIVMIDSGKDAGEKLVFKIEKIEQLKNSELESPLSLTAGYANYESDKDEDLLSTLDRADNNMYRLKQEKKKLKKDL